VPERGIPGRRRAGRARSLRAGALRPAVAHLHRRLADAAAQRRCAARAPARRVARVAAAGAGAGGRADRARRLLPPDVPGYALRRAIDTGASPGETRRWTL